LRYERRALSRRKFTIFVPCVRTNPIIFLANDASGGAAAGKIACVEFIDENGGGASVRLHKTSAAKTFQIKGSALEWRK
jgi:hypothetical protein